MSLRKLNLRRQQPEALADDEFQDSISLLDDQTEVTAASNLSLDTGSRHGGIKTLVNEIRFIARKDRYERFRDGK